MVCSLGSTHRSKSLSTCTVFNAEDRLKLIYAIVVLCASWFGLSLTANAQAAAQFHGAQSTIPTSTMNQPESVAVDGNGNVYIADSDNGRVLKETFSSGSYTESVIASGFTQVTGIAVDSKGNVYFANNGPNQIIIETLANGSYTQSTIQTNGLTYIDGIAIDSSRDIFIANNSQNGTIVEETLSGGSYVQSTVITGLTTPKGVAVDGSGNLYIADTGNNTVLKETLSSGSYTQSVVVSSGLGFPWGVAVDGGGNIYIADAGNGRVLKETPSAGTYTQSTVSSSALNNALGLAVDTNDNVYVVQTETSVNNILKLTPATTSVNFGSVDVGIASTKISLFFSIETGGMIGVPSVVTQGIDRLDFTDAGTGTCTTNGSSYNYSANATCSVDMIFTPTRAGVRYGAGLLESSSGSVIATGYVQGTGIGPQLSFPPTATQLSLPNVTNPYAVAVDAAGNLYIAQAIAAYDPSNALIKETWNGSGYTSSTIVSNLGYPTGVAVDGAGDIYIADQDGQTVLKETPNASGGYTQSIVDDILGTVGGIAVDGSGNVYVGRGGIGVEKETLSNGGYIRSEIFDTFYANSIAVDATGTLFIADGSTPAIRKESPAQGGYTENIILSGQDVAQLALNSLGTIYFTPFGSNPSVFEETPSGSGYTESTLLASGPGYVNVADSEGNLYFSNDEAGNVAKLDLSDPPALYFVTTPVGQVSSDSPQSITIANTGNASLSLPVPNVGTNPSISAGFTIDDNVASACPLVNSGSATAGTLAAGTTCDLAVSFSPSGVGPITGSLILTDNLNAASPNYSTQTASLGGTGIAAKPTITWITPAAINYGTPLSSSQLDATASVPGTFSYSPAAGTVLGAGAQTLSVTFTPGDTTDYTTATATVTLTVSRATPAITWSTPAAIAYGTPLRAAQLNASSTIAGSFAYTPDAGTLLGVGSQTLKTTLTPTDTSDYTASTASVTLMVNQATPGIMLAASSNSTFLSDPVTFTATLVPASGAASGAAVPTGSVSFFDGTTQLAVVVLSSGSAVYTTSALTAATHAITAVYSGNANYVTATSPVLNEVIENFTVAPPSRGSTSASTSPGGQAVYTLVFSPPSGATFPAAISLSVTGLPAGATATFSPASIPAGAGATTVTLTVNLPTSSAMLLPNRSPGRSLPPVAWGLIFLPLAVIKRKYLRLPGKIVSVLLLAVGSTALIIGLTACGGRSGSSPQTYTLTVTATSGELSNSTTLSLTVE